MKTCDNNFDELIVRDAFSFTPGARHTSEGEFSGEEFRTRCLKPAIELAIQNDKKLYVVLDGTAGYGTSFLEESFGGLIREDSIEYQSILDSLVLVTDEEPYLKDDVLQYLSDAHIEKQK